MRSTQTLKFFFILFFVWNSFCFAEDSANAPNGWSRFRGPNGTGHGVGFELPPNWDGKTFKWKIELPGEGHSSPVLWGDLLFISTADAETAQQTLLCYDAVSGAKKWAEKLEAVPYAMHLQNSYASSSPVVDSNRVYFTWAGKKAYHVAAFKHDGSLAWQKDLAPFVSHHGFGASPMLVEGLLILTNDQLGKSSLIAYDAATGKLRWTAPRAAGSAAYGTPCVYTTQQGKKQLIVTSEKSGFCAYDVQTGKQLWQIDDAFPRRCVNSPLLVGDLVIGTCGSGGNGHQLVAVRLASKNAGENFEPEVAYKLNRGIPYVPTPIAYNDMLFLWHDRGTVKCLDLKTGKKRWEKRIGGKFHGSPVCVDGKIFCVSQAGDLVVIEAAKTYKLVGRYAFNEESRATPAIADGNMFIRTLTHLYCIEGTEKTAENPDASIDRHPQAEGR